MCWGGGGGAGPRDGAGHISPVPRVPGFGFIKVESDIDQNIILADGSVGIPEQCTGVGKAYTRAAVILIQI